MLYPLFISWAEWGGKLIKWADSGFMLRGHGCCPLISSITFHYTVLQQYLLGLSRFELKRSKCKIFSYCIYYFF